MAGSIAQPSQLDNLSRSVVLFYFTCLYCTVLIIIKIAISPSKSSRRDKEDPDHNPGNLNPLYPSLPTSWCNIAPSA